MTLDDIRGLFTNDTFGKHLGIEIVSMDEHSVTASMPFDHRHKNAMGNTHGGAIFALADIAFAAAAYAHGVKCVNAQSSISYLSPGKKGPLLGVATPIRMGRRLITLEVRVTDALDTLVAVGTITGFVMPD